MKASKIKIKQDKTSKINSNQMKTTYFLPERYNQTRSLRPCETSSEDRGELGRVGEALKNAAKGPETAGNPSLQMILTGTTREFEGVALSRSPEETEGECPTCKKKGNPELEKLPSGFEREQFKPAGYFDLGSLRTLCPQSPTGRCSDFSPEEQETATRVIIGCKKGEFKEGKCQVGTEAHVIFHAPSNPGTLDVQTYPILSCFRYK